MRPNLRLPLWMGCAALVAAPAWAQDDEVGSDVEANERWEEDIGVNVGLGIGNYAGGLQEFTHAGPTWGVRVDAEPSDVAGVELAYEGARNPLEGAGEGAAAWRQGVSAMAKFAPGGEFPIQPFVGVGIGASIIDVNQAAEGSFTNDFVAEIPVALGLEYETDADLSAGIRATWRPLFDEEFAEPVAGAEDGSYLNAAFTLGGRF